MRLTDSLIKLLSHLLVTFSRALPICSGSSSSERKKKKKKKEGRADTSKTLSICH
jgi:hypothetical protein